MELRRLSGIVCVLLVAAVVPLAAVGSFTPVIDGFKDAAWGSTPDATSASYRSIGGAATYHSQNACQDVYVTDDPQNLYIGITTTVMPGMTGRGLPPGSCSAF
jgi:hypothetical protein